MFRKKGVINKFCIDNNDKIKSLKPNDIIFNLENSLVENFNSDVNIFKFSLQNINPSDRYNKNHNKIAEITEARQQYKLNKYRYKLNNFMSLKPQVKELIEEII